MDKHGIYADCIIYVVDVYEIKTKNIWQSLFATPKYGVSQSWHNTLPSCKVTLERIAVNVEPAKIAVEFRAEGNPGSDNSDP